MSKKKQVGLSLVPKSICKTSDEIWWLADVLATAAERGSDIGFDGKRATGA
jgi:hypothetical protein